MVSELCEEKERMVEIVCNGWVFLSSFDSGNLGSVEAVQPSLIPNNTCSSDSVIDQPDFEFNVWTKPDCAGTEFENGNRTWFYFGMREGLPFSNVKINIINLNKQCKMYAQGMTPVYKVVPGKNHWERIKDKPTFNMEDKQFTVSFVYRFGDTRLQTVYFAFTYPYTYTDLLNHLAALENHSKTKLGHGDNNSEPKQDDIYFHRELLTYSLESRRVDLITISSHHGITKLREPRLPNLFPDQNTPRCFRFLPYKKVIFLSARVHPGETPSSFVMAGMMNFLMSREDSIAFALRRHFVFKLIPMLNPDGVYCGNYRTDTRGVNLNRVYGCPSAHLHPSIYGSRAMIRYYHHGTIVPEEEFDEKPSSIEDRVSGLSLSKSQLSLGPGETATYKITCGSGSEMVVSLEPDKELNSSRMITPVGLGRVCNTTDDSGLFMYIDMHGHTSKKGIFMYGNHFENMNMKVECMLFPKLITLYSQHFLFDSCNFTEKNMYIRDRRDGSSREGCGRVAIYKATGLVRCYTLECNYNTGKNLNMLPPPYRDSLERRSHPNLIVPPKYTPIIYEEAGKSVLSALLDLVGMHPNTRLINSVYHSLSTIREVLRKRVVMEEMIEKDETNDKKKLGGKLAARKIRGNKNCRSRKIRTEAVHGRKNIQESLTGLSGRKLSEKKKKKKKKKLRDEGGCSSGKRRIEKKCCSIETSRRLSMEHRRKKLKPK
ncbi:cytosolic carboxypeptidase-like protein 5 isoform X2 [Halyomorpha halys]|uniref:cytosolic carboxypeptidase-like protein 5 isoform X2 n=1 Tax=Halyomorpha halys TaxID=286706 RepID=UPI0006D5187C|nr:cytosolic carboxypeptidase-like protein 5 isoform X2 [Halyomorpha halys]